MKKLISIILFIFFIPLVVDAKEYYLDNLDLNQELECGDVLYPDTPNDLLSSSDNTIANVYGRFSKMYGRKFYFEDESCIYNNHSEICNGGYCRSLQISCYPDGKERKWVIDNVKVEPGGEAMSMYLRAILKEPKIIITNHINDRNKYIAKKDEILKYSVTIKNTGDGRSTDNIIITNVPKGLLVLEDKISDNGIYDVDNNIITWNYELLGAEEEYTFNYYAKVIDDSITEYVGNSYLTSSQVSEKVDSEDTNVHIEVINDSEIIENPYTKDNYHIVILTIVLIASFILYFVVTKRINFN